MNLRPLLRTCFSSSERGRLGGMQTTLEVIGGEGAGEEEVEGVSSECVDAEI